MKTCRNCASNEFAPDNLTAYCNSCLQHLSLSTRNAMLRTPLKLRYDDMENCHEFHSGELLRGVVWSYQRSTYR